MKKIFTFIHALDMVVSSGKGTTNLYFGTFSVLFAQLCGALSTYCHLETDSMKSVLIISAIIWVANVGESLACFPIDKAVKVRMPIMLGFCFIPPLVSTQYPIASIVFVAVMLIGMLLTVVKSCN